MRFKTVRLMAICNGPKWIISVSGGFRLLQMVLKPVTERCASENARPPMEVDCEVSYWLERGTKHSL